MNGLNWLRIRCDCDAEWWCFRNSYSQISKLIVIIAPINTGGLTPLSVFPVFLLHHEQGPLLWKLIMRDQRYDWLNGLVWWQIAGFKKNAVKLTIEVYVMLWFDSIVYRRVLWPLIIDIVSWCEFSMSETTATAVLVESVVVPAVVLWPHNSSQCEAPLESMTNISEQLNCVTHNHHEWKIQTLWW